MNVDKVINFLNHFESSLTMSHDNAPLKAIEIAPLKIKGDSYMSGIKRNKGVIFFHIRHIEDNNIVKSETWLNINFLNDEYDAVFDRFVSILQTINQLWLITIEFKTKQSDKALKKETYIFQEVKTAYVIFAKMRKECPIFNVFYSALKPKNKNDDNTSKTSSSSNSIKIIVKDEDFIDMPLVQIMTSESL